MADKATSRDLANDLRELAGKLDSKDEFTLYHDDLWRPTLTLLFHGRKKDGFIGTAKAIGGQKTPSDYFYNLSTEMASIAFTVSIDRDTICKLVTPATPAVYECDSLFDESELEVSNG